MSLLSLNRVKVLKDTKSMAWPHPFLAIRYLTEGILTPHIHSSVTLAPTKEIHID